MQPLPFMLLFIAEAHRITILMTAAEESEITIEDELLTIIYFQTEDRDIVDYFCSMKESDDRRQKLEDALKMGVFSR